ncbi:hypothetical protein HanXRQr2_Chr10g0466291 [Helianthus annuus]|uniref:Uncharacterized protein n=1 Tax=Helianthus annuus TaxID=4232 RepID=A0A9K3N608_HELAN|nr:hypothetical protein HanXRQr2_Chr10g0466291 [Helianthus annuus]KAJ0885873.1 hypothetical protein HanPSC8_Chr10g0450001 [Helianthus annuus]
MIHGLCCSCFFQRMCILSFSISKIYNFFLKKISSGFMILLKSFIKNLNFIIFINKYDMGL